MTAAGAAIVVRVGGRPGVTDYRIDAPSPDAALATALAFEDAHARRFAGEVPIRLPPPPPSAPAPSGALRPRRAARRLRTRGRLGSSAGR